MLQKLFSFRLRLAAVLNSWMISKELLRAGADKNLVNSAAVRNPDLINKAAYKFGSQCVVCAIDAKERITAAGRFISMAEEFQLVLMPLNGLLKLKNEAQAKSC